MYNFIVDHQYDTIKIIMTAEFNKNFDLVIGLKCNMKNKFMPLWNKIILCKRYIIEFIDNMLKNKAQLVQSGHRSINNFIMNLVSTITAYCFFDNKPKALTGYEVVKTNQLNFF